MTRPSLRLCIRDTCVFKFKRESVVECDLCVCVCVVFMWTRLDRISWRGYDRKSLKYTYAVWVFVVLQHWFWMLNAHDSSCTDYVELQYLDSVWNLQPQTHNLTYHPIIIWFIGLICFSPASIDICKQQNKLNLLRYTDTHAEDWPLLERSALAEMPLVPIGWWTPVPSSIPASPGCFRSSVRVLEEQRKTYI